MTKAVMVQQMLAAGYFSAVCELMGQSGPAPELNDANAAFPDTGMVRLINGVRNHLRFVARFGTETMRVVTADGTWHFAHPEELAKWLSLDVPGLTRFQVEQVYKRTMGD